MLLLQSVEVWAGQQIQMMYMLWQPDFTQVFICCCADKGSAAEPQVQESPSGQMNVTVGDTSR